MKPAVPVRTAVALLLAFLTSCGSSGKEVPLSWEPAGHLNAGLPDGIRVYQGASHTLPLKAWYVRVRESDPRIETRVAVARDEDARETVSEFAAREGAVVAVNGGYFRMDLDPSEAVGLLHIGGRTLSGSLGWVRRDSLRYPVLRGALGFFPDGRVDVAWAASRGDTLVEWPLPPDNLPGQPADPPESSGGAPWYVRDALAAGPVLVRRGRIAVSGDEEVFFGSSIPEVHPRTAAGYTAQGELILLVVDGRQPSSRGVDLRELAAIMKELGCVEAVNLDGGGSSTLVVNGRLVNRPAGGSYQREVLSAITVRYVP